MWYKRFKFFVYFIAIHALLIACILFTDQSHPSGHHNSLGIFVLLYGFLALVTLLPALSLSCDEIYDTAYWPFTVPTLVSGGFLSLQSTQPSLSFNLSWAVFAILNAFFSATLGSLIFSLILQTGLGRENSIQEPAEVRESLFDPHWSVRLPPDDT